MCSEKPPEGTGKEEREDLTGEHPLGDAGQILIFLLFIGLWVADSVFWKYSASLAEEVSDAVRIPLAVIVLVISAYLATAGLAIVFGERREKPEVIRTGVFRLVRHPIYLSAILFYLALLIAYFSMLALPVWIVAIVFYIYICKYEEKLLVERFGKEYEEYMKEVPMLIPRIRD